MLGPPDGTGRVGAKRGTKKTISTSVRLGAGRLTSADLVCLPGLAQNKKVERVYDRLLTARVSGACLNGLQVWTTYSLKAKAITQDAQDFCCVAGLLLVCRGPSV